MGFSRRRGATRPSGESLRVKGSPDLSSSGRSRKAISRIAIDTGGTFTDCVWVEDGEVKTLKVFSTPSDPSQAIVAALEKIGLPGALVILHGTTVGTNTLLQRKGARVALITTKGFEDAIEIGRQARPKLYDFFFERVEPLVLADLRFGVAERTDSEGRVLVRPSVAELSALKQACQASTAESIAISFLFSFASPENEYAVAGVLAGLGLPLSVSHQILPEFREYERTSTVVVNAYLRPIMQRYLENLERCSQTRPATAGDQEPKNRKTSIFVMQSSGGITALASAAREPVRTVLSGPAGGVVGAAVTARCSGEERIISFDMGGTSTDVSLVEGDARVGTQSEVAGLPVGVPMLDIHTVGAGGGSIARFDTAGALRVGPESAGSDPGPICYGRGTQPTVTDANLLLGRLRVDRFLGGDFTLDIERTRQIVGAWLKQHNSALSVEQFSEGVIRVANATMEKAIRVVSIERGYDPRDFALVAFGGAGGMHACELAKSLSIPRVIVPVLPGALSAFGILVSDVVKDYSRTLLWRVTDKLPAPEIEREFQTLRQTAAKDLRSEGWQGAVRYLRTVDVRYRGQGYELNVPFTLKVSGTFHHEHLRRYGYNNPEREIELVTVRLRCVIRSPQANVAPESARRGISNRRSSERLYPSTFAAVVFGGKKHTAGIYSRDQLPPGRKYLGPAVVAEYSATTVVPPGMRFWMDRANNLVIATG
jgi:N-methylhydantoinase A